ncbi:hypothetical protein ACRAWF_38605 [Streptomyces sp. L7]
MGTVVEERDPPSYVAGLVVTNDVSARDVQLTKTQFYESKSYPRSRRPGRTSACWNPEDFAHLLDLRLRLRRQRGAAAGPHARRHDRASGAGTALLARFQTAGARRPAADHRRSNGGAALEAPPARREDRRAAPARREMERPRVLRVQAKNPRTLRQGDADQRHHRHRTGAHRPRRAAHCPRPARPEATPEVEPHAQVSRPTRLGDARGDRRSRAPWP